MDYRAWIVGLTLVTSLALPGFAGSALAATQDVTTTWNVSGDTSFSVSFPAGHTGVDFDPTSGDFTDLKATDQTDAQWAYRVTNDGNVNVDVVANFTGDFPSGVTEFRTCTASSGDTPSGTCWWWADTNETSGQTVITALAPGANADRWAWTTGSGVIGGTSYTAVYRLTSSAS